MRGMSNGLRNCWQRRRSASMRNARLIWSRFHRASLFWTSMLGAICARLYRKPDETSMDSIRAGGHDLGCIHGKAVPPGGFDGHGTELRSAADAIGRRSLSSDREYAGY